MNYLHYSRKANKLAKDEKKKMNSYYNVLPTVFSLSRSPSPLFPPYMYVFIFTWGGGRARQLDEGNNTKGCDALGA